MEENKQEQQTNEAPEANNESAEQEQQAENLASNENAFNAQEEIKKLNDRIDNVLMQLTINNDETVEDVVEEKQDEDLDF